MKTPFSSCPTGCGGQLELFSAPVDTAAAPPPASVEFDWDFHDFVVVGTSSGKDSAALLHTVSQQADTAGALHKIRVLHCDLGATPGGHSIEWPGVEDLARRQAAQYGVPFAVRRSTRWKSLWDRILSHGNWPGYFARYCTSDTKTVVGRDHVDELGAGMRLRRPIRAGYALGMRAEESGARAKKPIIERHRMSGQGTLRVVTTWLPIHQLKVSEVWKILRDNDIPTHPAYKQGMRRLSCRFCPLAAREDLIRSAQLNPGLAAEYAGAENRMGKPFKKGLPMKRIIELARELNGSLS